jgi:hypothetical protein
MTAGELDVDHADHQQFQLRTCGSENRETGQPSLRLPMRIRSKFPMCVRDFDFMVGAYNIYML